MNAPYYGSCASAYPDNAFGRSPLNDEQLRRLRELAGKEIGSQKLEMEASQVTFTRPELSPCLSVFEDKNDPRYREALAIIEAGKQMLSKKPRADMPGFKLTGLDLKRQRKYDSLLEQDQDARTAVLERRKIYSSDKGPSPSE